MSATRRLRVHLSRRTERFILAREGGREEAWRSAGGSVSQTQATSNLNADDGPPALPREFPLRPSTPYLGPKIWIILCFFLWFAFVASPTSSLENRTGGCDHKFHMHDRTSLARRAHRPAT
jgi:hypothetical protein